MKKIYWAILAILFLGGCGGGEETATDIPADQSWEATLASVRGQTVTLMMWQGDPLINQYMKDYVVPTVKDSFDITLDIVPGQGNQIVSLLMTELEAGKNESEIDMAWINGETFFQLRQIDGLYGPFVETLPNSQYVDWDNPFIKYDFQQEVGGFECPWGNVQMALIYNSEQVEAPPQTLDELKAFVKAHPGKFTIGNDFTGMTLLKSMLADFAGGRESLKGQFDEALYERHSTELWAYLNEIKPYFWNEGETFPADVAQMHQLFANGELWFTMSNNDAEVDNKIKQGLFNDQARAYVPKFGTIQNSHYLGIAKQSAHKDAARVVINFLISPAAQLEKMQPAVWGDGSILSVDRLPAEWQDRFADVPGRTYAPDRKAIRARAVMEPAPEYMLRLFEDFRKEVIDG